MSHPCGTTKGARECCHPPSTWHGVRHDLLAQAQAVESQGVGWGWWRCLQVGPGDIGVCILSHITGWCC
jgi:hypothetical protein